jgi:hypothetical protein
MENNFKHTPGPWKIFYPTVGDCGFGIDTADEKNSIVVMDTEAGIYSAETREEDLANAKLIAAAPDLLEACLAALDSKLHWNQINSMLKKAIKKAKP